MANSRKRPPKPDPADSALLSALQRCVTQAGAAAQAVRAPDALAVPPTLSVQEAPPPRARMGATRRSAGSRATPAPQAAAAPANPSAPGLPLAPLLIAYSGGPDSTVLLELCARLRAAGDPAFAQLLAVHVHHGLQAQADAWVEHCTRSCAALEVPLEVRRVRVARGRGVEDGARRARYEALAQVAREQGAALVLTAHHGDDRIETFLLQWLRGAGLAGLAGIAEERALASDGLRLLRPLLECSRAQILAYQERHGLVAVDDPSNADTQYARNALRHRVIPPLEKIRSGFRRSALRSLDLVAEGAELLEELAREGLVACTEAAPEGMLRLDRLAALPPARRALVLRAWLARAGIEAPSRARLREALEQALGGGRDGRMLVRLGARELRLYRGLLALRTPQVATRAQAALHWNGEEEIAVPSWGGVLRFVPAQGEGFSTAWLRAHPLHLRGRTGGERFKPHPTRPSKSLKQIYQDAGVPEFERAALPLVWREERLIYVARIGADVRLIEAGGERVCLEWQADSRLLEGFAGF